MHKISQNLPGKGIRPGSKGCEKFINNWKLKSITFAHFKTEWTARRRKAGWGSNHPSPDCTPPGQSPVNY